MPQSPLAEPLKLPCGVVLPNRVAKAAMTGGLADDRLHATERHETLYGAGGWWRRAAAHRQRDG